MTTMTTTSVPPRATTPELVRTARTTGLLYLGLALTGLLGSLLIRNQLFIADDAPATLNNLVDQAPLARLGIALEMGVVITQALVALWFYRLFRRVNRFAAGSLAAFGMVNAAAILVSAALIAAALEVSQDPTLALGSGAAGTVHVMYIVSANLWIVSGIFFGLWLIPMGWLARQSGWMPDLLGWILMIGGFGYIANAFLAYLIPNAGPMLGLLTLPATIGELWMVGYLCLRGVRRVAVSTIEE